MGVLRYSKHPIRPSVKRFSSGSGNLLSLSQYTTPPTKSFAGEDQAQPAAQESDAQAQPQQAPAPQLSLDTVAEKMNELIAQVNTLTGTVAKLQANQAQPAAQPTVQQAPAQPATEQPQPAAQPQQNVAANGNQTTEQAVGAEVPGNAGTYTKVPESEIISQFSKRGNSSKIAIPSLGNKDTFNVLFK